MFKRFSFTAILALAAGSAATAGPYAPAAGQEGSTAIHKDDPALVAWATGAVVVRGPMDLSQIGAGQAAFGSPGDALGKADDAVVSLGDGGYATVSFDRPIGNGAGYDFAVFENAFSDTFLEIAFVEVSSNGTDFVRFDAVSLSSQTEQIGGFGSVDTTNLHNFAGKYRRLYGTPFDLLQLGGEPGLDVNHVTHVRIVDVVGSVQDEYATYDCQSHKVNDPWPTPYESSGFDLDAVGVIHQIPEPGALLLLLTAMLGIAAPAVGRLRRAIRIRSINRGSEC